VKNQNDFLAGFVEYSGLHASAKVFTSCRPGLKMKKVPSATEGAFSIYPNPTSANAL
jgi:hypothetical protein